MIRWRRLFISSFVGAKPARRRNRSRFGSSGNPETLEVRQLLSATAFATPNSTHGEDLTVDQLAIAEQVQSLSASQFRTLTAEQAPFLGEQQIHGLRNRAAFQRIPLEARQALTADQVSWLRVRKTGLQGLTNDQIDDLTTEQVQSLKVRDLRRLTASQVPNLSADQTSRLSSYHQLRKLPEDSRGALTGDQIRMLDVGRSRLNLLTDEQIGELSLAQLEDVRRNSDVEMLSSEQHEIRSMMAPPARPASISAMTVFSEMPVGNKTVGNKTVGEIRALTYRHFDSLTAEQTPYLSLEQVASIPSGWHLNRIPEASRFALTPSQVQALNVSETGLSALAADQILELSEAQVQSLNYREFERLAPPQIPLLSAEQLSTIPNSWWFGRLSDDARSVLTVAQVQALRVDNLGLSGLTPTQVAVLALDQIQSLSFREFHYLTEAQTPLLSTDQVATIPNSWWFGHISEEARAALTPEQVQALDVSGTGVSGLTPEQASQLSSEHVQALGYRDFDRLSEDQIVHLTGEQISSIRNGWYFKGISEEPRYSLTDEQIQSLNVAEISIAYISPGLGYVNHQSYVNFTQNVAFNVVGSSFFTEFGDEIGSFVGNLSIANTGSGDGLEDREDIFDFGHGGHGFWMQRPGVEVVDNISTGARDSALNFFTTSSEAKFQTANMADPSLAAGRHEVPVGMVPLRNVSGNTAFGSRCGLETWFHQTHSDAGQSYIDDFNAWNVGRGMFNPYTGRTTIRNATLIGNVERPRGTAVGRNNVTNQMTYEDVHVEGWDVGIDVPVNRTTVIRDGYFEAVQAIRISTAHDSLREVDILGDPEFVTLTDLQLRGRTQFDIFMDGDISVKNRDIETHFTPDIVRLGTVRFNNHQAYYHKQAADFVPFPAETAPDWMPAELIGKTNTELWTQYGIAPGGTIAPEDAVEVDRVNGLVGSRAEYQTRLQLRSAKYTNQITG